jgi:hypothetical protein
MKYFIIGSSVGAAVLYAALTWGPLRERPAPVQPSSAAVQSPKRSVSEAQPRFSEPAPVPEPAVYVQQPAPRIEMPDASVGARQGATEPTPSMAIRRRPHRAAGERAPQVNRPVANGFTAELNRQEMQSLEPGGRAPASAPWRELTPRR